MKDKLKHINISILVIIILLSAMLIGTPLYKSNVQIVYIASGLFSVFYFLAAILKKEKIINNKIDIAIVVLTISTLIPLVFKTYVTLTGTVHRILQSFCILGLYLIAKNECKKEPKYIDIILHTIIISILLLCIIGIDEISGNYLQEVKNFINYKYIELDEVRIGSLFSYPNTMAAVAGLGFFLSTGYLLKSKKIKIKFIYFLISILMIITMVLTYSRIVYILFALTLIFYICMLIKQKEKKLFSAKPIAILVALLIIGIAYIGIALNISQEIEIENGYQKILYRVEPNTDYTFKFDINSKANYEERFKITLIEKNEYFDDVNKTEEKFGTFEGIKEIKIHTQEETQVLYLNITANEKEENETLLIKEAKLNEESLILKYRILPTNIVEKVKSISLQNKSAWERTEFIKGAIKNIEENWIFGYGGNAWRTLQTKHQNYNYSTLEVHCYPVQTFLENGIVGFIACLGVGAWLLKLLFTKTKQLDEVSLSTLMAILFVLGHSLLDFDMSFFFVELIIFIMIATLGEEENYQIKGERILEGALIVISLINMYVPAMEMYYKKNTEILRIDSVWTKERKFNTYYKMLPYLEDVKIKRYEALTEENKIDEKEKQKILKDLLIKEKYRTDNLMLINVYDYIEVSIKLGENLEDNLEFAYNYIIKTEMFSRYIPRIQINRFENLKRISQIVSKTNNEEYAEKFQKQYEKEIDDKTENILNYTKARYEKKYVEQYKETIEKVKSEDINI